MPTFSLVRKKNRRKRNVKGQIRRTKSTGRFTASGRSVFLAKFPPKKANSKKRRRNPRGSAAKTAAKDSRGRFLPKGSKSTRATIRGGEFKVAGKSILLQVAKTRRGKKKAKTVVLDMPLGSDVRDNPRRRNRKRRRKNARRRNGAVIVYKKLKNRPRRRRNRSRGRRRNPFHSFKRRKNRRRRNPFAVRRRNPFSRSGSMELAGQVLGGTLGLSVALWGPKLLGHKVNAMLGRGWGGVATSAVSVGAVSWVVSRFVDKKFGTKLGPSILVGGGIGVVASLFSAISCGYRQQFLPFESSLLACALPMAPASPVKDAANQAQALAAKTGMPISAAVAQIAAGLKGYDNPGTQQAAAMIAGELASRAGLSDYVSNRDVPGMRDYPGLNPGPAAQSVGMDASKETF